MLYLSRVRSYVHLGLPHWYHGPVVGVDCIGPTNTQTTPNDVMGTPDDMYISPDDSLDSQRQSIYISYTTQVSDPHHFWNWNDPMTGE
jgi:hypothetical protein